MDLIEEIVSGSQRAVARAISVVENELPGWMALMKSVYPHTGRAYTVGFTGPTGSGKSTLVDRVARLLCDRGFSVGVVAVDPSSPFTHGALLGDRVRMHDMLTGANVFFRSLGTRGGLGGLSRATSDVVKILDASGKEFILIETIGIGQDEIDIVKVADSSIVISVPGLGDDIQTIKAGIMEIGDIFVVNKADREGADQVVAMLTTMLGLGSGAGSWKQPVIKTVATERQGVPELLEQILAHRTHLTASDLLEAKRRERIGRDITKIIERRIAQYVYGQIQGMQSLDHLIELISSRKEDPYSCAERLLTVLEKRGDG